MDQDRDPPDEETAAPGGAPPPPSGGKSLSGRETYNVVSDTVIGVNVRLRDNLIQGVVVVLFAVAGALIVGPIGRDEGHLKTGLLLGAVIGLICGVVITGAFIMVYRAVRHLKGKHD